MKDPSILVRYSEIELEGDQYVFKEPKELSISIFTDMLFWGELLSLFGHKIKDILNIPEDKLIHIDSIDINKAMNEIDEILKKS